MQYSLTRPASISFPLINFKLTINLKIFWILGFLSIVGLLIVYIYQANNFAQETFLINNYQRKIKELKANNETLEIIFAQSSSLNNLESYLKTHNLQKANRSKYIRILDTSVVTKQK